MCLKNLFSVMCMCVYFLLLLFYFKFSHVCVFKNIVFSYLCAFLKQLFSVLPVCFFKNCFQLCVFYLNCERVGCFTLIFV